MSRFIRFPHTPHLAWLGEECPRDDKVLADMEIAQLLSGDVEVEEKLDGANLGISIADDGVLRLQSRGQYLQAPFGGQFSRLTAWLLIHQEPLLSHLGHGRILFGEWCAARHSIGYTSLPDLFISFDIYDIEAGCFWSTRRRNALAAEMNIHVVSSLFRGRTTLDALTRLLSNQSSAFTLGPLEGLIIRSENRDCLLGRAKLVRSEFTQAIDEHWSRRGIEWNAISRELR